MDSQKNQDHRSVISIDELSQALDSNFIFKIQVILEIKVEQDCSNAGFAKH